MKYKEWNQIFKLNSTTNLDVHNKLTGVAIMIYPNTDIHIPSSWIRHATGIDSFRTTAQVILRVRIIIFTQGDVHTPSITAWRTITLKTEPSRVRIAIQSYESASTSWDGGVWTAVEGHSGVTGVVANRTSITSNDTVVVKWCAAVRQLGATHIYPSTCKYRTPQSKHHMHEFITTISTCQDIMFC